MSQIGTCSMCNQGPKKVPYYYPKTKKRICPACYKRVTTLGTCPICHQERNLAYLHPETKKPICPTCYKKAAGKRSLIKEGICSECGDGPKPIPYRHPETKGDKDNGNKGNICNNCYIKIKRREKNIPLVKYYLGDLVRNRNPKDPDVYGRIGKVVESSEKKARVNFGERGHVTRVYRKGENFKNITLYARFFSVLVVLVKAAERETVLV